MSSTDRKSDIDNIARLVAEQVKSEFLPDDSEVVKAVNNTMSTLSEAYAPQTKTYALTTNYLSETNKKEHEKLYIGYVDALSRVSAEIDGATKQEAKSTNSAYRSAKKDETYNHNAVYLHELFFANCFDLNSELFMDSLSYVRLSSEWGSFDSWMHDFMQCALSSRNGWVVCGYSAYLKKFVNVFVDGHDQGVMIGLIPLLVVDMWEHSYYKDYGTDKKTYVTAMMREISWEVVEVRVKKIDEIKRVMA